MSEETKTSEKTEAEGDSLDIEIGETEATATVPTDAIITASSAFRPDTRATGGRGGRASSEGPFITEFVNCDFPPHHMLSSMVHTEGVEPGKASHKSYVEAYRFELAMVNLLKSTYGVPFSGNGKIGRWRAPLIGADGKQVYITDADGKQVPQERIVWCVNVPQNYLQYREADDLKRAGGTPAPRAARGTAATAPSRSEQQLAEEKAFREKYNIPADVPIPGFTPSTGRGGGRTTAPRATATVPAAPATPAPIAAGLNLEDALASLDTPSDLAPLVQGSSPDAPEASEASATPVMSDGGNSGGFGDTPPEEEPTLDDAIAETSSNPEAVEVPVTEIKEEAEVPVTTEVNDFSEASELSNEPDTSETATEATGTESEDSEEVQFEESEETVVSEDSADSGAEEFVTEENDPTFVEDPPMPEEEASAGPETLSESEETGDAEEGSDKRKRSKKS